MNILFLSTHLNTGGITSYLLTLTKGMIHKGHKVTLASSTGDCEGDFRALGADILNLNIRTKSELDPRIYLALKPLKDYIRKNNIGIIHAQTRITQVMGHFLKGTSLPYVATCHGFFKPRLSRKLFPCWGDAVVAISHAVQGHLIDDFHVDKNRVHLINNGIDIGHFAAIGKDKKDSLRKKYQLGQEPLIGIIARLSDVKGQDILLEAMPELLAQHPATKLLIVGSGKLEAQLKNQTQRLKLQNNVVFIPHIENPAEILSLLDVFVMPSRQEGLGLSVMEAQAAGLPVVASRVGGIPSLIEDHLTGVLVEPENPPKLARAVLEVLEDKIHAQKMGLAAREFIKKNYSAEKMVNKTLDVYQKLLKKGKR